MKPIVSESPRHTAEHVEAFAEGHYGVLGLISPPGWGKTSLLEKYLPREKALWRQGNCSPIRFYISLFTSCAEPADVERAIQGGADPNSFNLVPVEEGDGGSGLIIGTRSKPSSDGDGDDEEDGETDKVESEDLPRKYQPKPFAVLDDCDSLYKSEAGGNLLKIVTNTQPVNYPGWDTSAKQLEEVGNVKRFGTRVRCAITSNSYENLRRYLGPVVDRGVWLLLQYSPETIHSETAKWFLDGSQAAQEVYDFIGESLDQIATHSFRTYVVGRQLYEAGVKWRVDLIRSFNGFEGLSDKDKALLAMIRVMADRRYQRDRTNTNRCREWMRLTGQSMPAFYRWLKEWQKLGKPGLEDPGDSGLAVVG